MKILGLIPARGGSKRVLRKNIRALGDRPLIAHTIELAAMMPVFTRVVVSTEDAEIAQISKRYGAEVLHRPSVLAQDDTPMAAVYDHALQSLPGFDFVCLLQPTSPLRTQDDIECCIQIAMTPEPFDLDECVSVCNGKINGAVYVISTARKWPTSWFVKYEMPIERSIDIDTIEDFLEAETLLNNRADKLNPHKFYADGHVSF